MLRAMSPRGAQAGLASVLASLLVLGCGPTPPPGMETCTPDGTPVVTAVRIWDGVRSIPLSEGDPLPIVSGPQGGSHVQFLLELEGTGFGRCGEVTVSAGTASYSGGVRVRPIATGAMTSTIVVFPPDLFGCLDVRASAYGQTAALRLGTGCTADAGTGDGG